jgi:hypothetical protein
MDDLREIEQVQKRDEFIRELFHNTALIHMAMRMNGLLRPIFRKYKHACMRILQQKKDEANQLLHLYEYCDSCNANGTNKHDLQIIQAEMSEIHDQIKSLEEVQFDEDDEEDDDEDDEEDDDEEDDDEEEEEDDEDDEEEEEEEEEDDEEDDEEEDDNNSISSSSSFGYIMDISDLH